MNVVTTNSVWYVKRYNHHASWPTCGELSPEKSAGKLENTLNFNSVHFYLHRYGCGQVLLLLLSQPTVRELQVRQSREVLLALDFSCLTYKCIWKTIILLVHQFTNKWQFTAQVRCCCWADGRAFTLQLSWLRSWHIAAELTYCNWAELTCCSWADTPHITAELTRHCDILLPSWHATYCSWADTPYIAAELTCHILHGDWQMQLSWPPHIAAELTCCSHASSAAKTPGNCAFCLPLAFGSWCLPL